MIKFTTLKILVLLFVFDIIYLLTSGVLGSSFENCIAYVVFITMVVLGFLHFLSSLQRFIEVQSDLFCDDTNISSQLRKEFSIVRKQNIRKNLLKKVFLSNYENKFKNFRTVISRDDTRFERMVRIEYYKKNSE